MLIDEVRLNKNALTAKEVSALYKYPAGNKGQIPFEGLGGDAKPEDNADVTENNPQSFAWLTAGTITSKTIILAVSDGEGDAVIRAGKTDFNNNANGFILGLDDSDGDKAKFYIGSTTKYLNWTGVDLNVVGGSIVGGTIKTATSGFRVELSNDDGVRVFDSSVKRLQLYNGQLNFYDTDASWAGRIIGELVGTDSVITIQADYIGPHSNNSDSLGYATRKWSDVWGVNGWFTYLKQAYSVNHDPHTAPASMAEGDVYYDSGLNKLRVNVGGANWETIQSS